MEIVFLILIYVQNSEFTNFNSNDKNTLSISSAREQLKQCQDNFKLPSNFHSEEFRLVANGFFQAEGHISCRIRDKYFTPVLAINQNELVASNMQPVPGKLHA